VFATIMLLAASSALAAPVSTTSSSGALFFMTNDPSGNRIVVSSLASTGKATVVKTISTGGTGATGKGGGPDALFSQDSVLVSQGHLFAVNAGSNTLSAFTLDPKNPASPKMIGTPVNTSGEFPMAVARSPSKLKQVCVANGGSVNGVACFHMSNTHGLMPMNNTVRSLGLFQSNPPIGPGSTVSDILFNEDGSKLIVGVKGEPTIGAGFIAQWDVAADGSLSTNAARLTASAGGLPFGMTVVPGKNALVAADPAVGATTFLIGGTGINETDFSGTNLTAAIPISGQGAVCWVARSPKTGSFFMTDIKTAIVTEVALDNNLVGKIVKQYPQTPGSGTIDDAVGTIKGNDFLYVLATNGTSPAVNVLSVGKAAGQAKALQTVDVGAALKSLKTTFTNINMQGMAVYAP